MIPNPIRKVLSSMRTSGVRCPLMGGQACILYGGAEFSRNLDLVLLAEPDNLARLEKALEELQAECIAVPPFARKYLDLGMAVHFRCHHPEASNLRINVMSRMRGVGPFPDLWQRRTTLTREGEEPIEVLALPDLVQAKKTQRDKDWPMIARLLEAHYFQNRDHPNPLQIDFWLREMRTVELLREITQRFPQEFTQALPRRPLLALVPAGNDQALQAALREEEDRERQADRTYWLPLKQELERLRHQPRS